MSLVRLMLSWNSSFKELYWPCTYKQSIGWKDHVIANLTAALQKQVCVFHCMHGGSVFAIYYQTALNHDDGGCMHDAWSEEMDKKLTSAVGLYEPYNWIKGHGRV